ncbi:DUF1697 domain-containing protein [Paractinoplanes brasiliensis]|uniref:Uncharacterized protein (DUF1697 family) n=1 Tax=Paractinoplanes brasiliensis TaxID=52695 RepID=A0A4R6JW66_9ACTN|nr:DUF1697 domain-containing protein [Actinoplanes brasiliensis]TDO40919.1 uncharacterized protein (DUF1697 family) [Actinoplanes brasiliensis]GID25988.1 hypothetical protein Abr02nite_09710 [Actinoplanes brasiliensis]
MTVWVALLRAVNLGARNKVPMAALRVALEKAGLPGARTLLQSGNVVVESELDVGPIIHSVLRDEFDVDQPVVVRSRDRLAEIVAANPFPAAARERPTLLRVTFLVDHPSAERVRPVEEHDDVRVLGREVYIDYRDRVHGNPVNTAMASRRLGLHGTERNWATVLKLAELATLL